MIHIATVHYRDDRWIDLQLRYLERHTSEPYRLYASLDRIDRRHHRRFDHALDHSDFPTSDRPGPLIEEKLRRLARQIVERAEPEDLLVFMHGDTLPIADWVEPVSRMVRASSLVAIRRPEDGEPVPHWSFCATTPRFWTEIDGDWARGPTWEFFGEAVTDTGARLWKTLEERRIDWHQLLRTNRVDLHPLFFGIYGDLVYHHGAGFRTTLPRIDVLEFSHLPQPLWRFARTRKRIANVLLDRRMFKRIREDERFYLVLTGESA